MDVVEGEAADRGGPLGVEQHEQAGDAVLGFEGVVVQQPAGLFPAGLGVDDAGGAAPPGRREAPGGSASVRRAQRTKFPASPVGGVRRWPARRRGRLGRAVARVQAVGGEPVEQRDGGLDVASGGDELAVGGVGAVEPAAQAAEHVPDGVAVQQLLLVGVGSLRRWSGDPAFQPGHVLVAGRQGADRDQHAAQVLDGFAGGQLVEGLVGELAGRPGRAGSRGGAAG